MKNIMNLMLIAAALLAVIACQKQQAPAENLVARGKYLVNTGLCHDCHSPKVFGPHNEALPDSTRLLSGHPAELPYPDWMPTDLQQRNFITASNPMLTAWAGPWGVSFAANLTPDTSTGLGEWNEETFIRALRTGKHQGYANGRDLLPPMPWQFIGQRTDDELKAIWAYLRSIPPMKNQVPFPVPPQVDPQGTAN